MNERREFLTLPQAAELYGFNVETLRKKIASGELPAMRLPGGREFRIERRLFERVLRAAGKPTRRGHAPGYYVAKAEGERA